MTTLAAATADQESMADAQRAFRVFVGLGSSILGLDQTYAGDDAVPANQTRQYMIANPDGSASVQGQPYSNQQSLLGTTAGGLVISPVLLILGAVVAYLVLSD
jgi:hypothetical protein